VTKKQEEIIMKKLSKSVLSVFIAVALLLGTGSFLVSALEERFDLYYGGMAYHRFKDGQMYVDLSFDHIAAIDDNFRMEIFFDGESMMFTRDDIKFIDRETRHLMLGFDSFRSDVLYIQLGMSVYDGEELYWAELCFIVPTRNAFDVKLYEGSVANPQQNLNNEFTENIDYNWGDEDPNAPYVPPTIFRKIEAILHYLNYRFYDFIRW